MRQLARGMRDSLVSYSCFVCGSERVPECFGALYANIQLNRVVAKIHILIDNNSCQHLADRALDEAKMCPMFSLVHMCK